jgi:hypothetical protein
VTDTWKKYNHLSTEKKSITWLTVILGGAGFLLIAAIVTLIILLVKAMMEAVGRAIFLR